MILNDVMILDRIQILNEGKSGGPMKIRGVFQRADEANKNNRIYSKAILEREMTRLAEAISTRSLLGELDHPMQYDNVKLSNVSHLITKLEMRGTEMIGEAEILGTPAGQIIRSLIECGVAVGISSRGSGSLSEDAHGNKYVNEDFKLTTFDMVADPSTRGAYPKMAESRLIESIVAQTCEKAVKEKVFITMLKNKLNEWQGDGPLAKEPLKKSKGYQDWQKEQAYKKRKELGTLRPGEAAPKSLKNKQTSDGYAKLLKRIMSEGSLKDMAKRAARERSRELGRAGTIGKHKLKSKNMLDTYKKPLAQRDGSHVTPGKHGIKSSEDIPQSDKLLSKIIQHKRKNESVASARIKIERIRSRNN